MVIYRVAENGCYKTRYGAIWDFLNRVLGEKFRKHYKRLMASVESYRRKASREHDAADGYRAKIAYKPHSALSYEGLCDRAVAEGFVMDSAARNFDPDPLAMVAGMRREQASLQAYGSRAFDRERFEDHIKMLIDHFDDAAKEGRFL